MIHSARFTTVLDTKVIYPLYCREFQLWFAHFDMYTPKWSAHIFDDWEKVMTDKGMPEEVRARQIEVVNQAFPDALVTAYEPIIPSLEMRDENDRHVLAAANKTNPNVIVTNNLEDFDNEYLSTINLTAKSPVDFLTDTVDLNPK